MASGVEISAKKGFLKLFLSEIKLKETLLRINFVTGTNLKLSPSYFEFSLVPWCFEYFKALFSMQTSLYEPQNTQRDTILPDF